MRAINYRDGRPCVLFVDDDKPTRELVELALNRFGFAVITASGQSEALSRFCRFESDVDYVLTDHFLLDGTGSQLSEELRKVGYGGRIVVVSGMLTDDALGSYRSSSVSGFLQKPFDLATLATMLSI